MKKQPKKYAKGHFVSKWMGIGIAIFTGVGVAFSFVTENFSLIGVGPAIGVAFGLSIGQSIENKHEKAGNIRPLTDMEKKQRKKATILGFILALLGLLILASIFLLK